MSSWSTFRFVEQEDVLLLRHELRVAWAATICERVLELYSPWFRKKYLQEASVNLAWQFALSSHYDQNDYDGIALELGKESLVNDLVSEGYHVDSLHLGTALLVETELNNGEGAIWAVDSAASAFSEHQAFRQGLCEWDPVVPGDYGVELQMPVYRLARSLFDHLNVTPSPEIRRDLFPEEQLELTSDPLPADVIARKETSPPSHEVEHIRQLYGPQ